MNNDDDNDNAADDHDDDDDDDWDADGGGGDDNPSPPHHDLCRFRRHHLSHLHYVQIFMINTVIAVLVLVVVVVVVVVAIIVVIMTFTAARSCCLVSLAIILHQPLYDSEEQKGQLCMLLSSFVVFSWSETVTGWCHARPRIRSCPTELLPNSSCRYWDVACHSLTTGTPCVDGEDCVGVPTRVLYHPRLARSTATKAIKAANIVRRETGGDGKQWQV